MRWGFFNRRDHGKLTQWPGYWATGLSVDALLVGTYHSKAATCLILGGEAATEAQLPRLIGLYTILLSMVLVSVIVT